MAETPSPNIIPCSASDSFSLLHPLKGTKRAKYTEQSGLQPPQDVYLKRFQTEAGLFQTTPRTPVLLPIGELDGASVITQRHLKGGLGTSSARDGTGRRPCPSPKGVGTWTR